jgi:signal transduction histidine kinase/ActR/RegA family two-component response regulator
MTTWARSRHPKEIEGEQAEAIARLMPGVVASILFAMFLGVLLQLRADLGAAALVWHLIGIGGCMFALRRRGAVAQPRGAVIFAGLYGCWIAGVLLTGRVPPAAGGDLLLVAAMLSFCAAAASALQRIPMAVVAFSAPLLLAACLVAARLMTDGELAIFVLVMAAQAGATVWLLRENWCFFVKRVDLAAERAQQADRLREQKEIAEKSGQLKSRFLAAASHDLRQPMHAISLYLGGLAELELPARAREAVLDARECAHVMNDMFRSLLDISRLDANQTVPDLGTFCIGNVLSRVEKEFAPLAQAQGVALKVRWRGDHVYSDPVMVERIAQNFVSNAVRHSPGGRVLVACRVVHRHTLRLAVYDTGRGIPLARQKDIFDEFHRLDTARQPDHTGGLGLGLAIVRRLAQTLHLPIGLKSKPGHGSVFTVDLPLVHVPATSTQSRPAGASLAERLIILVDDEASILQAASFVLGKAGCSVLTARSGPEAMEAAARCERVPDAIVCDYQLHAEEGPNVIRALREEFAHDIPALLVTGNTGGGLAENEARKLGAQLLYKPLEPDELTSSVLAAIGKEEH